MRSIKWSLFVFVVVAALLYLLLGGSHPQEAHGKPLVVQVTHPQGSPARPGHDYYVVTGPPSISEELVHNILCASSKADTPHQSPACGTEHDLYTLGQQYHIDPAYALAFFLKESSLGRYGVAKQSRSLGNIRCTPGYACIDGFRAYLTYRAGYEDWYQLIRFYIDTWHLPTVAAIVATYAPSSENDTTGYITFIERCVDTWRAAEKGRS
jgi:hypothetical protein